MKRFLCLAAAVISIAVEMKAQMASVETVQNGKTDTPRKLELGVKASIGSSAITGLPGNTDNGLAYRVGGTLDWYVNRNFSVNPELRLNHNSTTVKGYYGNEQITEAEFPLSLNYLELPVHAAVHIPLGNKCRLLIKTGPYIAYGLTGKTSVKMSDSDTKQKMPGSLFSHGYGFNGAAYDSKKHEYALPKFKRWDYGISYGMGLEYSRMVVSFDMIIGCASLTSSRVANSWSDQLVNLLTLSNKPRRMDFVISAGYKF